MSEEHITVEYIDGFLRCLSLQCMGCDYVPMYAAEAFIHDQASIKDSLYKHFGLPTSGSFDYVENNQTIHNFKMIEDKTWRQVLQALLVKWVDKRLFEGETTQMVNHFLSHYQSELIEQVEILTKSNIHCFTADIQHENYLMDCEMIGIVSKDVAFFIHFSFSD